MKALVPRPTIHLRLRWSIAVALVACARAEKPAPTHAADPVISTFAGLSVAFQNARAPNDLDLTGVWTQILSISTRQFLEGQDGPDQVLFDSTGLKVDADSAKAFEWTLTFARSATAKYSLTQRMGGHVSEVESVALDSSASFTSFTFNPDFGADEAITHTCRVLRTGRIICLDLEHPGSGEEFKQISTTVPPRPPPFCPLANMTECAGSNAGVDARRILTDSRVCYHLLYPLTHRPEPGPGTDTWLALAGDSLPPIGTWHYAAVFDDSIVRVAAWRRTAHTPPLPKDAHFERPPQRDSLELRLTRAGTNIRGKLGYGDAALEGTLFADETPYSWGIEGERRACPTPRDLPGASTNHP